jgi:hypothetical protein
MKTIRFTAFLIAHALVNTSCMFSLGDGGSLNASTYMGAPHRVEEIYQTSKGFAFKAIYKNKEATQTLIFTTDKDGKNAEFTKASIIGVPIPFKRISLREFYDVRSNQNPSGVYPYGLVVDGTGPSDRSGNTATASILTSPNWSVAPEFPRKKPDWAARVSQTPGAILLDAALLPILVPVVIIAPRING